MNETLSRAGLDFSINEPDQIQYLPYQPLLTKRSNGAAIGFQNLSSGEKILMSFAFCVYYSNDTRQISSYPKLLLFDEIDAPLHPSMSRDLLTTITKTLVESFGIKVIAATHSPSTIALAPEDSIFVVKSNSPGLHKTSKAEALNILTAGVPTLSISFEGRRQVFVESPSDAATYDSLYKLLKSQLGSDRSLEFISTGSRDDRGGETNTGCDAVKRIVAALIEAGNNSVFGLLDWDGKHEPSRRIEVLGHKVRNGLENVIFDPLLVAATIFREGLQHKQMFGAYAGLNYIQLLASDQATLQCVVDVVTGAVLGSAPKGESIEVRYLGGLILQIEQEYLAMDDHQLEDILLEKFSFLRTISRNRAGVLLQFVIETVLTEKRDFVPCEVMTAFEHLLNSPAH